LILLISASWVATITGVSHRCPAPNCFHVLCLSGNQILSVGFVVICLETFLCRFWEVFVPCYKTAQLA
jgi:hypothetical protein